MGRPRVLVAVLAALLPACSLVSSVPAPEGGGGGKALVHMSFRESPFPGARVEWRSDVGRPDLPPVALQETDAEGTARFLLPPGRYFLLARWNRGGDPSAASIPGDRFVYYGGNPVHVAAGTPMEFFLELEEVLEPPPITGDEPEGTGVAGLVMESNVPLEGAHVFAYTRTDSGFRDPGFAASAPTGTEGRFFLSLPPGTYYLLVRKRASGGMAGPLRRGDSFGYYPGNPVSVAPGLVTRVAIPATHLKLRNVPPYSPKYPASSFIEGRILDRNGNPRKGVHAALYDNPELLNRPLFLSETTGEDGRYRLPVPVPGRYYLGARSGYGGMPGPGDSFGRYEETADHSIDVQAGRHLSGIDIVVYEVR